MLLACPQPQLIVCTRMSLPFNNTLVLRWLVGDGVKLKGDRFVFVIVSKGF